MVSKYFSEYLWWHKDKFSWFYNSPKFNFFLWSLIKISISWIILGSWLLVANDYFTIILTITDNTEIQNLSSTSLNLISKSRVTCIPKSRYYGMIMLGLSRKRKRDKEKGKGERTPCVKEKKWKCFMEDRISLDFEKCTRKDKEATLVGRKCVKYKKQNI